VAEVDRGDMLLKVGQVRAKRAVPPEVLLCQRDLCCLPGAAVPDVTRVCCAPSGFAGITSVDWSCNEALLK
jgi:hypothetical protein